ncbi:MAG: LamG-like jellyroll fold domain-containing protein [Sedimentisphaeraceae bacterium JB056]
MLVLAVFVSTGLADRQYDLVELYHTNRNPASDDASGHVVPWCVSTLWLGTANANVTQSDIDTANSRLDDLDDSSEFTQMPQTASFASIDQWGVYWAMPNMLKVVLDPTITNRTTLNARSSVRNVLENFVAYRDKYSDAALTDSKLYEISGSMNHDWLRKTTYLLTAQHFKELDNGNGRNIYNDGYTAAQHYDAWRLHLKERMRKLAARGIDPEISPGYISVTLESMFNLVYLCEDEVLAEQAEKFINLYLADYAAESFHGIRGGGLTRVYKDSWAFRPESHYMRAYYHLFVADPAAFPWSSPDRTFLGVCMSGYSCPSVIQNLMTQTKSDYNSTSRRPAKGTQATRDDSPFYTLQWPSDIRRFTYCTSEYVMGGFCIYDQQPSSYYVKLNSQNQWMGLVSECDIQSRVYFQCGSPTDTTSGYSELDAIGNKGAMLIKRQENVVGTPDLFCWMSNDFRTNRVGPDSGTNYWVFSENTDSSVYVAVKAIDASSAAFYTLDTDGPGYGDPLTIDFSDDNTICVIQAAKASDYNSFSDFQTAVKAETFSKSGTEVTYTTLDGDTLKMYTDGTQPKINGVSFGLNISNTYTGYYLSNDCYDNPTVYVTDESSNCLVLNFDYYDYPLWDEANTVALWNMDSTSSGVIVDQDDNNSGRDCDLTLSGPALVTSRSDFGNALSFDGTNDTSYTDVITQPTEVKIECWLYVDSGTTGDNRWIVEGGKYGLYTNSAGTTLTFRAYDSGDNWTFVSADISTDTWQHVTAEFCDGTVSVSVLNDDYSVGDYSSDSAGASTLASHSGRIYVGAFGTTMRYFKGEIDDLRIFEP